MQESELSVLLVLRGICVERREIGRRRFTSRYSRRCGRNDRSRAASEPWCTGGGEEDLRDAGLVGFAGGLILDAGSRRRQPLLCEHWPAEIAGERRPELGQLRLELRDVGIGRG